MRRIDINDERSVRKFIRGSQLRSLFYIVFILSLVSWWKRGFLVALIAGSALYGFLVLMLLIGERIDIFMQKRRRP